jgi:hypothetical protein
MAPDRVIRWLINQPFVSALRIRAFLLRPVGRISVFLDDTRLAPRGWYRARKPAEVIALVKTGHVGEVSLDFDLGLDKSGNPVEGYEFATWLEREVVEGRQLPIPELKVHSGNVVGHERLLRCRVDRADCCRRGRSISSSRGSSKRRADVALDSTPTSSKCCLGERMPKAAVGLADSSQQLGRAYLECACELDDCGETRVPTGSL